MPDNFRYCNLKNTLLDLGLSFNLYNCYIILQNDEK